MHRNTLKTEQPLAIAIGFFDGVHLGHQAVFAELLARTNNHDWRAGVLTFPNHPRTLLTGQSVPLLSSCEEKLSRIHARGVQEAHVLDFNADLQQLDAEAFVRRILVDDLNVAHVVVGHDFHFGANRSGNPHVLKTLGQQFGFGVTVVPPFCLANGQEVSSRIIRDDLTACRLTEANTMLGYAYPLSGIVIRGDQLGRQLDFPTANIQAPTERLIPALGVYAVTVAFNGQTRLGMCNIGKRPTVKNNHVDVRVEVHLLDSSDIGPDALYGESLTLQFQQFIRKEQRFENLAALKTQLEMDQKTVKSLQLDKFTLYQV